MSRRLEDRLSRRMAWLMLARVVMLLVVLAAAVMLAASTGVPTPRGETGVLYAVLGGLAATIASGLAFRRFHSLLAFGALQVGTDVAVATAIIHVTGAGASVFSFLYVIIVAYAALLFDRKLAVGAAVAASLAYTGSLLLSARGWGQLPPPSLALALADSAVKAGALLVVAALASGLARELTRADRALAERTRDFGRLRDLHELTVQSLGSGLLTTDPNGVVRSFNREAERITGLSGARAVGEPVARVLPGAERLLCSDSERRRERMPFVDARQEFLHLGLAASVLRDAESRPSGHVVIFQDISSIVEMEQELRRSERMAAVGELAAGIAHEVRNPLASISGSVQMLRSSLSEEDQEQQHLMDIVLRETDRVDSLIGDFLYYARPAPPKPEAVPLEVLVSEVEEMYATARPENVQMEYAVPSGLRPFVDPDQLRQLLWNLLLNAGQAIPKEGGTVRVEGRRVPAQDRVGDSRNPEEEEGCAWIEITVSDTGIGIPPEILDRVFEPFFTTKSGGSGLGLATVHRIVEANDGVVGLDSELGRGTDFRLRFREAEGPAGSDVGAGGVS